MDMSASQSGQPLTFLFAMFQANPRSEPFVPHAAVLSEVAVLVTQCSLSTVMKGLAHGVPLV